MHGNMITVKGCFAHNENQTPTTIAENMMNFKRYNIHSILSYVYYVSVVYTSLRERERDRERER